MFSNWFWWFLNQIRHKVSKSYHYTYILWCFKSILINYLDILLIFVWHWILLKVNVSNYLDFFSARKMFQFWNKSDAIGHYHLPIFCYKSRKYWNNKLRRRYNCPLLILASIYRILKSEKNCNFGKSHILKKSRVFEVFSNRAATKEASVGWRKKLSKNPWF